MRGSKLAVIMRPSNLVRERESKVQDLKLESALRSRSNSRTTMRRCPLMERINSGSIKLELTAGEERQLMVRIEELARMEGLRDDIMPVRLSSATQALLDSKAADSEVLKHDGSVPLSGDWDIGYDRKIKADEIRARDSLGLRLCDDDGSGVFVEDGGYVGIGTTTPSGRVEILDVSNPQLRLTHTDGSLYTDLQTDSSGYLTIDPTGGEVHIDAIMDFTVAMGDSGKDPSSDAPDDWIEVKIGGLTGYVPWYTS